MRNLFFVSALLSLFTIFLLPLWAGATAQGVDLRIQILPADDGEDEPDEATTTQDASPPTHASGSADSGQDSALERAHDAIVDVVDDLINRVITPDSGTIQSGNDVQSGSRDLSLVWDEDDASAVRMLIVVPPGAAQDIDEVLITHLAFDIQQVRGVADGDVYDISMFDEDGQRLSDFSDNPITVTMRIPESLQGRSALGLFYLDETKSVWTRVGGAVFSEESVTFTTDHLSIFGIFALNPGVTHAQELVSEDGGMTRPAAKGIAGSATEKNMRAVAEIIVFMFYACIVVALVAFVRFSRKYVMKMI